MNNTGNEDIVNELHNEYVKIKIAPNVVNEHKDEIINKENPNYDQYFTDQSYDELMQSKKDIEELLPIIKHNTNISPEIKEKYLTDYQIMLDDINNNIRDVKPFISDQLMEQTGGKRKRKSKRKTKRKSHKRRRTNKRKSKAKRKSKRK